MTTCRSPENGGQSAVHRKHRRERILLVFVSAALSHRKNGRSPTWKDLSRQTQVGPGDGFLRRVSYLDAPLVSAIEPDLNNFRRENDHQYASGQQQLWT